MTLAFLYLIIFLGGFTLALVTGLVRRVLHPSELCDHVVVPSHEHWRSQHTPWADALVSFVTLFGLVTLGVHGLTTLGPETEVAAGVVAGLLGVVVLRTVIGRVCDPSRRPIETGRGARVVRDIPPHGFGQIELELGGTTVLLAARSQEPTEIPAGSAVEVLDRQESVIVVRLID